MSGKDIVHKTQDGNSDSNVITLVEEDDCTQGIVRNINDLAYLASQLRESIIQLERIRSECKVVSYEVTRDCQSLRSLIRTVKSRILAGGDSNPVIRTVTGSPSVQAGPQKETQQYPHHQPTTQMAFLDLTRPDIAVTSMHPAFNQSTIRLLYSINTQTVICTVDFSEDGESFVFADAQHVFHVRTMDGSVIRAYSIPQSPNQQDIYTRRIRISHDGRFIAINALTKAVALYQSNSSNPKILNGHTDTVSAIAFTRDGQTLITGGFDSNIILWDLETFGIIAKIPNNGDTITSMSLSDEAQFIAVGFTQGLVGIFDHKFSQPRNSFIAHEDSLQDVSVSHDSLQMVTAAQDSTARVWSLRAMATKKQTLVGHQDFVLTARFTKDDRIILTGSKDESIKGWETATGKELFTINIMKNSLFEIATHPTKNLFVACTGDGFVGVWEYPDLPPNQ